MPDVIAEQGALQDAIESPSTSVSRLGAAGWMKGKVADLNAIGVTENVSRLAAAGRIMGGIYDADPLATSTFYAPLLTTLVLSRGTGNPTFTRATTAYVEDFEGVWRQVPSGAARFKGARMVRNLASGYRPASTINTTETSTTIDDPFGGNNAGRYRIDNAGSYQRYHSFTVVAGTTVRGSIYLRGVGTSVGKSVGLWLYENGTTVSAVVTLTSSWQRFSPAVRTSATGGSDTRIGIAGFIGGTIALNEEVDIFGGQGEDVTGASNQAPGEWVSRAVLSAPYHGAGADGIKYFATENGNSVASNVVTEATGAAIPDATLKGYLAEGQRQNRCLYSQDFTNAAWVSGGGGIAVTPNTAVAPDGTTTADTLTASGANGTLIQNLGVVASAAKAGGLYLKRKTGTGNIDLTLDGGSTWTTVAVTSSWLLLEKTQTLADEDFGIRIVTSGDAVYAWQAQVETVDSATNSRLSSPIPTTTVAVTRNVDTLTYTATGNILDAIGSVYCEFTQLKAIQPVNPRLVASEATVQGPLMYEVGGQPRMYDGTTYASSGLGNMTADTMHNLACSWSGVSIKNFLDGNAGSGQAYDGSFGFSGSKILISQNPPTSPFGCLRNVRIWSQALPDATLQSITT